MCSEGRALSNGERVSLILIGCGAAALALASGYLAARRGKAIGGAPEPVEDAPPALAPATPPEETDLGASLRLNDVVALASVADVGMHRERWLSGGLVLKEGGVTCAVIFSAHEGMTPRYVVSYAAPRDEILWSSAANAADTRDAAPPLEIGVEPPTTIEHRGAVLSRKRRLHVDVLRVGKDAPRVGSTGLFVEYGSSGRDALVLLASNGVLVEVFGQVLRRDEYDPMGSGASR